MIEKIEYYALSLVNVICIFECVKIWRIHCICQGTNMNMM